MSANKTGQFQALIGRRLPAIGGGWLAFADLLLLSGTQVRCIPRWSRHYTQNVPSVRQYDSLSLRDSVVTSGLGPRDNPKQQPARCILISPALVSSKPKWWPPPRILELHSAAAEVAGRLSPLYTADRGAAVRLLSPRGHLPLQLVPLWLHLLCGQLHPSGLPENTDQPPEQGGLPRHLSGASLC